MYENIPATIPGKTVERIRETCQLLKGKDLQSRKGLRKESSIKSDFSPTITFQVAMGL